MGKTRAIVRAAASGWKLDPEWQQALDAAFGEWQGEKPKAYKNGLLVALVSRDLLEGEESARWHVSVQHRDRVPSWDEMARAGHELRPGVAFVIGVPPKSWWINMHEHVLHLWEVRDTALLEQWKFERRGDRPT